MAVKKNPWLRTKPSRKKPDYMAKAQKLRDDESTGPFYVRGQKVDSKEEYWCALALEKIEKDTGWGWAYQVPLYGGRMRGGNVADFVVYTPGMYTILDPKGRYWHTGIHEDQFQMRNVARKRGWRLVEWFTDEVTSKEQTLSFLRNKLNA